MDLAFRPLSHENFNEALILARSVFPEHKLLIGDAYKRSLDDPHRENHRLLEYWTVSHSGSDKIIATTGFYNKSDMTVEEVWLGWYCVDPSERGKGIGKQTLEWTIGEARRKGYKVLRLWTSTDPEEAVAQSLYEKLGLKVYDKEFDPKTGETILYREIRLQ